MKRLIQVASLSSFCLVLSDAALAQHQASEGLEEIIVTAQRRSENVQKTPIAISVVSGNDLLNADVSRPDNLAKLVPGLSAWRSIGGLNNIYVRGIGAQVLNAFGDQAVA